MPYIHKTARAHLDSKLPTPACEGELAYCIARLADSYLQHRADLDDVNFVDLNTIHGVLSGAADEWYRRVMVPYEVQKCSDNGDVYSFPAHLAQRRLELDKRIDLLEIELEGEAS